MGLVSSPSYPGRILVAQGRPALPSTAHQWAAFRQVSAGMGRSRTGVTQSTDLTVAADARRAW